MVLRGRKPFVTLPHPGNLSDGAEVFEMRGTGEVFTDYESYLRRYELLSQKKYVDAVNGKSGLTFFEALESENKSSAAIEDIFPPVLRDPILRKVQFSTISRMDDLVNAVYDEFKKDFFPGETVHVFFEDGDQFWGLIREKAKFPMIRGPDGAVQRPAFSRYFVRIPESPDQEALVDDKHIRRDKKIFTKQNLRAFLKNSLQREPWHGAPWLVKEHLAIHHRLPMEIPAHLMQDAKLLANKVYLPPDDLRYALAGPRSDADYSQQQMLQMRPPKSRRSNRADEIARQHQELARMQHMQQQHPGAPQNQMHPGYQQPIASRHDPRPPPPPPIRYPIEDLELPPKHDGMMRPQLSFMTDEQKDYIMAGRRIEFDDISMDSVGSLLEVWNTLNVQCEVFVLDSFTFDDFIDAMRYKELDQPCELLDEAHCAVFSQLVDKNGKSQIVGGMAAVVAEPEELHSDHHDDSELSTPQPDVPARSTRSRLSHVDPAVENGRTPTSDRPHRASEMLADRGWKARVAARDYEDGGWQVILVGLLHQLSANPMFKQRCEKVLTEMAPIDVEPSRETARERYASLDVNLRISALQMISIMSISTTAIKTFLDACSEDMTEVRKRKIEHQREKKICMEELQIKDRDRKILWPQNMPDSPKPESAEPTSVNGDIDNTLETNGTASPDPDEDEPPMTGRSLRRASDRKRKRDEDTVRREKEKAEKAEAAKEKNKQSKEFKKLLKDIDELKERILDHESKIQECDADLREANVQRTKVLGKDRFCNRYYWFERNGQPFGGLPRSSTASYGYANGRIWVQGPDDMEADGFINLPPDEQKQYRARFGMSVIDRRKREEGATSLLNAQEWAYIDDPARLDNLIGWLDERGEREKKLRKELIDWRELIAQYMEAYKAFHDQEAAKKVEADEEQASRVSTRHKTNEGQTAVKERCLKWTNSMALDEMGHIHSRPEKKPAPKAKTKQAKGVATLVSRTTGKPVTRQGGNYSFK